MSYGLQVWSASGGVGDLAFTPWVVDEVWTMTLAAGEYEKSAPMPTPKTQADPHSFCIGSLGSVPEFGIFPSRGTWAIARGLDQERRAETFTVIWLKK
ncbi:MAG: hypothetical protein Q4G24_10595 [Paracoccus sp. (in: a-proteobacteria)]|uniref:hypothetical protein n=1 Tax=Paracoccus sp. TaxID=267 RepID=UPI0026E01BC6|nr:hypothetical protein [Paracoccus sp. (in: a-proteobacteria)]MDO5621906.1 hypothetical protein [Paracoccus sp. (in: a-proteobacteria)]